MSRMPNWRVLAGLVCIAALALVLVNIPPYQPADYLQQRSEKSKRSKKQGYPDLFAQYHAAIRTADNELEPSYPDNYRVEELRKAVAARKRSGVPLPWVERGPGNVSGRTRAIVVDASDPTHQTWFAGAVAGGIWKTTDGGESWVEVAPDLPNLAIASMAQAASNPSVFYAGTGEGFFSIDAAVGAGIFKSTDGGTSWVQLLSTAKGADFRYVNRLVIDPANENVVVAATREGIFRTTDGGQTWTQTLETPSTGRGVHQVVAQPGNFNVLLASVHANGVARSTDGGQSWSMVENGLSESAQRIELAFAPSEPSRVYAAVEAGLLSEVAMSTDGGVSWILLAEMALNADTDWLGRQGWYNNAIAVHPYKPDSVFLGGVQLWEMNVSELTRKIDGVTGVEQIGTESFLTFVNFSAEYFGGALRTGDLEPGTNITKEEFVSVELRFGPGKSQRAHRFIPPDGPGIAFTAYPYADYVEVPFEAWDVVNNRQLMVSFRDRLHDGAFDLVERDDNNLGREYMMVHAVPYDESAPDPSIGKNGGPVHKLLYFTWPMLATGATWNPDDLPESTLRINYDSFTARLRSARNMNASTQFDGPVHVDHHNITIVPTNPAAGRFMMVNGNDGGIYKSMDNGNSWSWASDGYNTTQFYGADKKPGFPVYMGGMQDNGTWMSFANPTASSGWSEKLGGDGFSVEWHDTDPNLILGGWQNNGFHRTNDGGRNWRAIHGAAGETGSDLITDTGQGSAPFISWLATTPAEPDLVFTTGKTGVWKSEDFGLTWRVERIDEPAWGFTGGAGHVDVSLLNPNVVWAGQTMNATNKLHVSLDRGSTFTPVTSPPESPGRLSGIATHPHSDRIAYALFSASGRAKILRTKDFGETWEDISGFGMGAEESSNGFPDAAVYDLLVLPDRNGDLWAATEIGLFISENDGASWQYADNGLPAVPIWQLRIVDGEILAATHGRGVWTLPLSSVPVASESVDDLPTSFSLGENYPNPFNPSTTIEFDVPSATHVSMTVFDVAGRRIATLANEAFSAGRHRVEWDATGVASGTYYYRLQAGDFVETRSMVLVK